MLLVYKPAGAEEQRFEVDFADLDLEEIGLIESHSGQGFRDFTASIGSGGFGGLRALLFVYLRRTNPQVHYRDVKPKLREVDLEMGLAENLELRERVAADSAYPNREEVLALLDEQIAEARAAGEVGKEGPGTPQTYTPNRASRRRGKPTA